MFWVFSRCSFSSPSSLLRQWAWPVKANRQENLLNLGAAVKSHFPLWRSHQCSVLKHSSASTSGPWGLEVSAKVSLALWLSRVENQSFSFKSSPWLVLEWPVCPAAFWLTPWLGDLVHLGKGVDACWLLTASNRLRGFDWQMLSSNFSSVTLVTFIIE